MADPDGGHAYVASHDFSTISVIDTETDSVTATIPAGVNPEYAAISPGAQERPEGGARQGGDSGGHPPHSERAREA